MEASQIYILIAISVLAIVGLLVFVLRKDKKKEKFTPLVGIAFGFILAGILFSNPAWLGYSFFGVAIILSVIDMIIKLKKK